MTDWLYRRTGRFFAACADGLESLLAEELSALGALDPHPSFRGVYFSSSLGTLCRVNYMSRLATRVLAPLATFDCHSTKYLYKTARGFDWSSLFDAERTFAITCNVSDSLITHSQYAALCLKDAIVDAFRESCGRRPDVERTNPEVGLDLFIQKNRATISLDTSGGSLHRRGYRVPGFDAPMQETVAAAIVKLSGWDGEAPLHDPMCGSGTLLAEALMHHCRIPAGFLRERFGFEGMPGFDHSEWRAVRAECDSLVRPLPECLISGSDVSRDAVGIARRSLQALPGGGEVRLSCSDFRELEGFSGYVMMTNPPYGIRLGMKAEAERLVRELGDFLKRKCPESRAFIYFGDRSLLKSLGLRPSWRKPLRSGQLDGRLVLVEIHDSPAGDGDSKGTISY
ncbi:class I SAM-dependent RNA methyltransferase [Candidatus Fermentibacteria bacterium]|nr:class I SAM-dependent RNA methyltransferase [Candidatus Fermentibacteria bacterium]